MKTTKKIIALIAICFTTISVYAQEITDNYSRVYASFGVQKMKDQTDSDKGFQIGYISGINITGNTTPLFLQLGGEINLVTYSEEDARETLMSISVPANLSYKIAFSDNLSVEPFAGMNFRLNMVGKLTEDDSDIELNYFDDLDAKRFQFGINVGASININNVSLGYRFNPDLTNYFDIDGVESKTKYHFVSLGINF